MARTLTLFFILGFAYLLKAQKSHVTESLIESFDLDTIDSKYDVYRNIYLKIFETHADSALMFVNEALNYAEAENNLAEYNFFCYAKAKILKHKGKLEDAIDLYVKSYHEAMELGDSVLAIKCLSGRGATYIDLGDFELAGADFFTALNWAEKYHLTRLESQVHTNIGMLFLKQNEWEKSIYYFNKSIEKKKELNDLKGMALIYNNIGISYYYLNILDSVLVSFNRSLDMYIMLGDKKGQTRPLFNIGEIYAVKGDYIKALEYCKKSLDIEKAIDYKLGYANSLVYIGDIYTELGKYDEAINHQHQGISILKEIKASSELKDAYFSLYNTYLQMNRLDSALVYYINMSELKDSIFSLDKVQQIAELEAVYQTKKKENEILLLEQQRDKERYYRIILLSAIMVLIAFVVFLIFYLKLHSKTSVERALANEQKKQFRAVLEAQENERKRLAEELHDNMGPLLSLAQLYLTELNDSEGINLPDDKDLLLKSQEILNEVSNETRNISHNLMPGVLVQLGLVPAIRQLLDKLKAVHKFDLYFEPQNADRYDETIEITYYRIVQELINNIIKHAQATKIGVDILIENEKLNLIVEDNGKGFNTKSVKSATGIGWKNIFSRLTLIGGQVFVDSDEKGTRVKISSPLKQ